MSELKQITAGRKGIGGPKTEAGKQAASRNATKHGIHAKTIDAFAPSDREDFEALHREYATHYNPKDLIETELVHQLAFNRFRYYRFLRFQEAALSEFPDSHSAFRELDAHARTHQYIERTLTHLDRDFHRALRLLEDRQKLAREAEADVVPIGLNLAKRSIHCTSDPELERLMENAETNSADPNAVDDAFLVIHAIKPKTPGGWRDIPQAA